jgi:hypothetical protein
LPELQRTLDEAAARGRGTIDHAFRRALVLAGVTVALAAAALLLVRWITLRWKTPDARPG